MCQFFSAIATRDGRLLFYENDRHEIIIQRAGLKDTARHLRSWVRVEALAGADAVRVDETSVPGWYAADVDLWTDRVLTLRARVAPALAAYDAAMASALPAYDAAVAPARAAYDAVMAPARAAYDAAMASALAAYTEVIRTIEGYVV